MMYRVDEELRGICREIQKTGFTLDQWADHESDDWFQTNRYSGGFDATEMEFTFSVWIDGVEYWFQFSRDDADRIVSGKLNEISLRLP